ncbi:GDP-L-fucose synthase [Cladochytrium tenue]|nr:GDP-L-fucose synthase [Cladochytrium tenue]
MISNADAAATSASAPAAAAAGTVVLVTGGNGLVGRALQAVLKPDCPAPPGLDRSDPAFAPPGSGERWVFVGSADADLRDAAQTYALFARHRPTHVVHLAARVGGLYRNLREHARLAHDNLLIDTNVIAATADAGVKSLVACLSTCVFPDPPPSYPLTEDMLHAGPPHQSNFAYAHAKRMTEVLVRAYNAQDPSRRFTAVIPTNIFGPHDNYNLEDAHVLPALIHKCYIAKRDGTPLTVLGSGRPLRQFIYSHDLARVMLWAIREYTGTDPLIVSPPESEQLSIATAARAVAAAAQFAGPLAFDAAAADGQAQKPASPARLRALLPATRLPFTPFQDAVAASVAWFCDAADARAQGGVAAAKGGVRVAGTAELTTLRV